MTFNSELVIKLSSFKSFHFILGNGTIVVNYFSIETEEGISDSFLLYISSLSLSLGLPL